MAESSPNDDVNDNADHILYDLIVTKRWCGEKDVVCIYINIIILFE